MPSQNQASNELQTSQGPQHHNTPDGLQTDHINRDRLDNRKANLRSCTYSENNRGRNWKLGKSGFKGVVKDKWKNRWKATISYHSKQIYVGRFKTAELAAAAYAKAVPKYHGEFSASPALGSVNTLSPDSQPEAPQQEPSLFSAP